VNDQKYMAHVREDGRSQTILEHLEGTARLAEAFAEPFGAAAQGRWVGMLHDIGKYSDGFQKRLHGGRPVDHSTAGAYESMLCGQVPAAFSILKVGELELVAENAAIPADLALYHSGTGMFL